MLPTCFGLTIHHQGAYCCALLKLQLLKQLKRRYESVYFNNYDFSKAQR